MAYEEVMELVMGEVPYPVPILSKVTGHVVLFGFSLVESTGTTAARLDLYDGTDTTGLLAIPIPLGAGMATEEWFGPQGLHFRDGLVPNLVSGAVLGSLFISDPPHWSG